MTTITEVLAYTHASLLSFKHRHQTRISYASIAIGIFVLLFPLAAVTYGVLSGTLIGDVFIWLLLAGLAVVTAMMSLAKKVGILFDYYSSTDTQSKDQPYCDSCTPSPSTTSHPESD